MDPAAWLITASRAGAAEWWFAAVVALALSVAGAERVAADDMIAEPLAVLQGLDKITAHASDFTAPIGKTVRFGDLAITVQACDKNPPEDAPESAAFLEIDAARPGEAPVPEFSGWMFAQSPALSALEDPIYDVIVLDCTGASASPPAASGNSPPAASGNSGGNVAR